MKSLFTFGVWFVLLVATSVAGATSLEVIATGLDNPRGLAFGPDGSLYVAEAGRGGDGKCVTGPERNRICFGLSGAVTRIDNDMQERIATGLPSLGDSRDGSRATGPHDISFNGDDAYIVTGLAFDPAARNNPSLLGGIGDGLGQLMHMSVSGVGSFQNLVDIAAYETAANPDPARVDSNPYSVLSTRDGHIVVDAAANDLLQINAAGKISHLAVFPKHGPESVPTSVVLGPDDAYYVGEFTGFPFPTRGARIYRVVPGEEPEVFARGFTNVIDIAFDQDDQLLVLEMFTNGMLSGDQRGSLHRISANGDREIVASEGLIAPTGLTVGHDGDIYISNFGTSAGEGQVVAIRSLIEPAPGDFDEDGILGANDIDLLSQHIRSSGTDPWFDLTGEGRIDQDDRTQWVQELVNTYFGDSNLDREFNSSDLTTVFKSSEYEDGVALNSTWAEGDWNGDGDFDSGDLVAAFKDGGYESGPRVEWNAVPEPTPYYAVVLGVLTTFVVARRRPRRKASRR